MLKKSFRFILITLLISIFMLTACNFPGAAPTLSDADANKTSVAQTVAVLQTQLAVNATPVVPEFPTATQQLLPTVTLAPTVILPTVPVVPVATAVPEFRVGTVTDVTIPDNTVLEPGVAFKKTWRVQNGGSAAWNSNFKIAFISGDAMGGPATKLIGQVVNPGNTIDISVDFVAPTTAKTYQGFWMMQTSNGQNFGLGINADKSFWVLIKVQKFFAVTNASPVVVPTTYTGVCPVALSLTATITTSAPGKVSYYFITNLGNTALQEITFDAAGTKTTAATTLMVPSSMAVTVQVYIDNPNHQEFPTVLTIPVTCTP
jgi:hypothetical protein